MPISVPAPVTAYFAASNAQDIDAAVATFAESAIVVDEGRTYVGRPAILSWLEEVFAKYGVTAEVSEHAVLGDVHRVGALVSGNFPGSPAVLRYQFGLEGEGIVRLAIG